MTATDGNHAHGTVLVANRGEIARRVIRTCNRLGVPTVAVYTNADALAPHVKEATKAACLGANPRNYTNQELLLQVCKEHNVAAIHPGYGFLSENVDFAKAAESAGIAWLGPNAEVIHNFALKHVARELAKAAGVPVLEGSGLVTSTEAAVEAAEHIGYPVLLKATGGGGGRGIYICNNADEVVGQFGTSQKQGEAFFGNSGVFVEKYIAAAHHVEVQIFGDGEGGCWSLGERECSIQRRHQKVLEETPSPLVTPELREALCGAATALGASANYRSAGTVEFLVDEATAKFYFLEVNTRLQVEHGITEMVHGNVDIVEWQLRLQVPGLERLDLTREMPAASGCAIEVRINGEDPAKDFMPCPGQLGEVTFPTDMDGVRVDSWVQTGCDISPYYDSLLAKLMVYAPTREEAIAKMNKALAGTALKGVPNNLQFLQQLVKEPRFVAGNTTTRFLEDFHFTPRVMEVVAPGMQTSVQDWPGRTGLWHVGVPPSGPMDALSFRLANALVGNDSDAAGLEFSLSGPSLKFHCDALVALCGATFNANLDGQPVPSWASFTVKGGQTLAIGAIDNSKPGVRGYLAIAGGLDVPVYLGSRATFPGGNFGGYQGRYLQPGDSLPVGYGGTAHSMAMPQDWREKYAGAVKQPAEGNTWVVGVLPGPHADPDYLTTDAMDTFYSSPYGVHYNSNRLGIRFNGPKPSFARADGGEGGSHPSNVHDHIYAIGAVNFTGDMPIVLAQDGPSLGGFVCPATIVSTEMWKMGQVRPNDNVQWRKLTIQEAYAACLTTDKLVEAVTAVARGATTEAAAAAELAAFSAPEIATPETKPLLKRVEPSEHHPGAEYRLAGDRYIQIEYGPMELDIELRVRVAELEAWFAKSKIVGVVETNPGVRSCMIEYDQRKISLAKLIETIDLADSQLPDSKNVVLPSRIVHLPMAWEEKWTRDAIDKYMRSARPEAPYLPSNIQYMANNNGLSSKEEVREACFNASYLVLGLGDVYLGAPCAVPVDPRHRLVTTKYNPARTFTAEGTVGIGGSYMCIYPMNSPGGYQLVGRTLPIWNTFGRAGPFNPEKPWLLEFFDQVRFFQVSEEELEAAREGFQTGQYEIKIEAGTFDMAAYSAMLESIKDEVAAMKERQKAAMTVQLQLEAESLARIKEAQDAAGSAAQPMEEDEADEAAFDTPENELVRSAFTASVWDIKVAVGDKVACEDTLVVLEAMKMESPVVAPCSGTVKAVRVSQGQMAPAGTLLVVIEKDS